MARISYTGKQEDVLRPDERLAQQQQQSNEQTSSVLKSTAKTLGGAALGAGLTSKVIPFLNDFIPVDLALKGISKLSPKLGNFLKDGMSQGLDLKEGLNFIKEKMNPDKPQENPEKQREQPKEQDQEDQQLYDLAQKGKTQGNEFLKVASKLVKNGTINDQETFSQFYKWWKATKGQKRGGATAEFEAFRRQIGNTLAGTQEPMNAESSDQWFPQQQAQQPGAGQQAIIQALQMAAQARQKRQ